MDARARQVSESGGLRPPQMDARARQVSESRGLRRPRMNAEGRQVSESRASVSASKVNTKAPISQEMAAPLSDTWGVFATNDVHHCTHRCQKSYTFHRLVTLVTLGPTLGDAYRSIPIRAATYDNWLVAAKRS